MLVIMEIANKLALHYGHKHNVLLLDLLNKVPCSHGKVVVL
ncbi:hypothetical protein PMI05_03344 [Brevibacillus sp. BC25]|nr:hypothetical protein PMI05_03344 [Brevibacillus sp. BC25]